LYKSFAGTWWKLSDFKQTVPLENEMMSPISDYLLIIYFGGILLIAAVIDMRIQKIPNLLTLPALAIALIYHCFTNGISGFLFSIGGLAAGLMLLFIPYLLGGMGAGDAKLMAMVGATIGARGVFISFLFTALAGGVYSLALIVFYRGIFRGFFKKQFDTLLAFILTRKYIPEPTDTNEATPRLCYGLAIAFGTGLYIVLKMTNPDLFIL
jgi:prepilin peptidase CpaA